MATPYKPVLIRAPYGWAGLAQIAVPEMASQAVRERIRRRWEQRRAETDGETVATGRWMFDGRYTYPLSEHVLYLSDGLHGLADSQKRLVEIRKVAP